MKDQYFGDRKDFIKFDLALTLYERIEGIGSLAYIPMLTPNDDSDHGKDRNYDGSAKRPELHDYLKSFSPSAKVEQRHVERLRDFMLRQGAKYYAYQDHPYSEAEQRARHVHRRSYFDEIPGKELDQAVILIDPDVGLSLDKRPKESEKYLLTSDLPLIWAMPASSVTLMFQYIRSFHKRCCRADLDRKSAVIHSQCQECSAPLWIACDALDFLGLEQDGLAEQPIRKSGDVVAFFAITGSPGLHAQVKELFEAYANLPGYICSSCMQGF